ncbi:hypothetical protein DOTSEDRAFT_20776 [Dothistroma septosporum NZE10]|uniref:Uncharacterized protein n=1 Tax=Dothistroma septosporum (strain NZE10 / CBS 128990) TaxID=675120 RepID=N1PU96_DOTSN|nr:hypothetical protein DOTSEDRAFT_20776 [Dothistroma septosporum NZE10]
MFSKRRHTAEYAALMNAEAENRRERVRRAVFAVPRRRTAPPIPRIEDSAETDDAENENNASRYHTTTGTQNIDPTDLPSNDTWMLENKSDDGIFDNRTQKYPSLDSSPHVRIDPDGCSQAQDKWGHRYHEHELKRGSSVLFQSDSDDDAAEDAQPEQGLDRKSIAQSSHDSADYIEAVQRNAEEQAHSSPLREMSNSENKFTQPAADGRIDRYGNPSLGEPASWRRNNDPEDLADILDQKLNTHLKGCMRWFRQHSIDVENVLEMTNEQWRESKVSYRDQALLYSAAIGVDFAWR